jgi:hypothetical protein
MGDREMSVWFPNLYLACSLKFPFGCTQTCQFCHVLAALSPNLTSMIISGAVMMKHKAFDIGVLNCTKSSQILQNILGLLPVNFIIFLGFIYYNPIGPLFYYTAFHCDLTPTWPWDHFKLQLMKTIITILL